MTYHVSNPMDLAKRAVQLADGPAQWWVKVPADVPVYALVIDAPSQGSYGAGWAEGIAQHNFTIRVFGELAAVWPADADQPAWLYQRSGHARTGRHDTRLAWCPAHAGYLVGDARTGYCRCDGLATPGCPEGAAAYAGLRASETHQGVA